MLVAALLGLGAYSVWQYWHSPYRNGVGIPLEQPIQFSHRHHAGDLRIDCRYCHASAERSAFAGLPDAHTCLTCHSQLFTDTAMLAPLVDGASRGEPLRWQRVNQVPDHVFFNHAAHVERGVACTTCHGEVNEMPLVAKARTLDMRWCLDCHRDVQAAADPAVRSAHAHLTNCSTCHH